jgi:hypothetical protein
MRPWRLQASWRLFGYLALTAVALANAGCLAVAAGAVAAGGVAGYAYYQGGVSRDYAAGFEPVWAATQQALGDLGLPPTGVKPGDGRGTLESRTGAGDKIEIAVEALPPAPSGAPRTRVSIRVGVFGDHPLSDRLLDQVQSRLGAAPGVVTLGTPEPPVHAAACQAAPRDLPAQTAPPPLADAPPR